MSLEDDRLFLMCSIPVRRRRASMDSDASARIWCLILLQVVLLISLLGIPAAVWHIGLLPRRATRGRPSPSRPGWCCSVEVLPLVHRPSAWAFQRFDVGAPTPAA